jgi:predicted nucleic acid-binding protein
MSAGEAFFDTSALLYLLSGDDGKADRVEELLRRRGHISVQVLNELAAVNLRKRALSTGEIREFLAGIREFCRTHPLTPETHEHGLDLVQRHRFSLYDSMIIASALGCGCRILYSEDLQHGQVIEKRLKVVNPFSRG